jgi:hypothetical protein
MRYSHRLWLGALLLVGSAATRSGEPDDRLKPTRQDFVGFQAFLRPRPEEEKWLQIPWLTDLWEARKKAAAEGKPILLWEMDGSPMACG